MRNVILGLIAVVAIGALAYVGCDGAKARMDVASDQVVDKIDGILGKLNVQQKEVENAFAKLEEASEGLREKRIEAEVRVKNYNEKKVNVQEARAKLKKDLERLKPMLVEAQSSGSIERDGKTYTIETLKGHADKIVKDLGHNKDQMVRIKTLADAWSKNFAVLKKNDDTSRAQLAKLSDQIEKINSKKSALDAMKEAASIAGPGASISDKFENLTQDVDELLVKVDTEFAIEESKIDDRIAGMTDDSDSTTLDELLDDKTNIEGTLGDIDALLNEDE